MANANSLSLAGDRDGNLDKFRCLPSLIIHDSNS